MLRSTEAIKISDTRDWSSSCSILETDESVEFILSTYFESFGLHDFFDVFENELHGKIFELSGIAVVCNLQNIGGISYANVVVPELLTC